VQEAIRVVYTERVVLEGTLIHSLCVSKGLCSGLVTLLFYLTLLSNVYVKYEIRLGLAFKSN
jgi:hypothetical protein